MFRQCCSMRSSLASSANIRSSSILFFSLTPFGEPRTKKSSWIFFLYFGDNVKHFFYRFQPRHGGAFPHRLALHGMWSVLSWYTREPDEHPSEVLACSVRLNVGATNLTAGAGGSLSIAHRISLHIGFHSAILFFSFFEPEKNCQLTPFFCSKLLIEFTQIIRQPAPHAFAHGKVFHRAGGRLQSPQAFARQRIAVFKR